MLGLLIGAAALGGGFVVTRNFVRRRLRFVDAVRKPAAPLVAGLAATVVAQALGLVLVAIALPLFPAEWPSAVSALWAVGAGVTGGTGVALLYYGLR